MTCGVVSPVSGKRWKAYLEPNLVTAPQGEKAAWVGAFTKAANEGGVVALDGWSILVGLHWCPVVRLWHLEEQALGVGVLECGAGFLPPSPLSAITNGHQPPEAFKAL